MLGNAVDILDKYKTEFGDGADEEQPAAASPAASSDAPAPPSSSSSTSSGVGASPFAPSSNAGAGSSPFGGAVASSPFAAGGAAASPFGAGGAPASPFGGAAPARPSRLASIEPKGLSPDMSPDPIVAPPKDTRSWLSKITITQVVLFFSFSTIIGLMIATFFVVLNTGAVRLAGLD